MNGQENMTTEMVIQYSIVGLVLLAAFGWILWKLLRKNKKQSSSCCGCSLSENCKKKEILNKKNKYGNH